MSRSEIKYKIAYLKVEGDIVTTSLEVKESCGLGQGLPDSKSNVSLSLDFKGEGLEYLLLLTTRHTNGFFSKTNTI